MGREMNGVGEEGVYWGREGRGVGGVKMLEEYFEEGVIEIREVRV